MSEKDQVKPYHAREASTGQETADAVADVLKHAAERDEAAQKRTAAKPTPKWMLPLAMNLGLLAVYFLVAQPSWTAVNPIQPPPTVDLLQSTRDGIYYQGILRIEGYRSANGRLPASLADAGAGVLSSSVQYEVRPDSTYTLTTIVAGQQIVFDSATMRVEEFTGPMNLPG